MTRDDFHQTLNTGNKNEQRCVANENQFLSYESLVSTFIRETCAFALIQTLL